VSLSMSLVIVFPSHQTSLVEPPNSRSISSASFSGGREGPVSGEGGNRPRVYITDPKKNCLAGFATIE